jgi:hypothetical protein
MPTLAPKGLATIALLKTRLDEGKDHLGLFEPFVEDTVVQLPGDHFAAADLRTAIEARHSLLIPLETVTTLLGRLGKRNAVRKEGGRYFRLPFTPATDIVAQTSVLNDDLLRFGEALVAFSLSTKHPIDTAADALALLIGFIQENNIAILLSEVDGDAPPTSGPNRAHYRVVARFITTECSRDDDLRRTLERVVEGLVLKNALLLDDLAASAQRFDSLEVFLDSYIAFAAIGLTGVSEGLAVSETLALLKETGAVPAVFDVTIAEMRRLLAMLEDHLGTAEGRMSLRPTAMTRHVLTANLKPSDVRIISASLEPRLRELGISVKDTPPRDRRFTLDEGQLSQDLADWTGDTQRHRVRHDVDCVAGVLTLRAGRRPRRLEAGRAIFASTSPRVIRNVSAWHRLQGEAGLPPIIDIRALANIAWLKRPASARSLKVHQLVALCSAALRPSRETWDKFIGNLKHLREQGALSDEHTLALVASELVEPILSELEDEREPDAASIHEAIDRVKAAYREEGRATVQQALQLAEGEAQLAQQTASAALAREARVDSHLNDRAHRIGRVAANTVVVILGMFLVASILIGFPGAFERIPSALRLIAWGSIATAAVFTAWGYWSGFSVRDLRNAIELSVSQRVLSYLRPPDPPPAG